MQSQSRMLDCLLDEKERVRALFKTENDVMEYIQAMIELDESYAINSRRVFGPLNHSVANYHLLHHHHESRFSYTLDPATYSHFVAVNELPKFEFGLDKEQALGVLAFRTVEDAKAAIQVLKKMKIWLYLHEELGEFCIFQNPVNGRFEVRTDAYGKLKLQIAQKFFAGLIDHEQLTLFNKKSKLILDNYRTKVFDRFPMDTNDLMEKKLSEVMNDPFLPNYDKLVQIDEIVKKMMLLGANIHTAGMPQSDFSLHTILFNFKKRLDSIYITDEDELFKISIALDLQPEPPELPFHPFAGEKPNRQMLMLFEQNSKASEIPKTTAPQNVTLQATVPTQTYKKKV